MSAPYPENIQYLPSPVIALPRTRLLPPSTSRAVPWLVHDNAGAASRRNLDVKSTKPDSTRPIHSQTNALSLRPFREPLPAMTFLPYPGRGSSLLVTKLESFALCWCSSPNRTAPPLLLMALVLGSAAYFYSLYSQYIFATRPNQGELS